MTVRMRAEAQRGAVIPVMPDCDCGGGNDGRVWHDLSCPWNPRNLYLRRRAFEESESTAGMGPIDGRRLK